MDLWYILDPYTCVMYIAAYIMAFQGGQKSQVN